MAAFGGATGARGRVAFFLGATHELDRARWVDRFTWRAVDAGIVVAHGAARWYAEEGFGPPGKMHVLWKGVDLAVFDAARDDATAVRASLGRSEEHTSELQSPCNLVCRLLLEKKKKKTIMTTSYC